MSFRTALVVIAVTAIVVSAINRAAGWSDDTAYMLGMAAMVVVMLICFPLMDPQRDYEQGSKRR